MENSFQNILSFDLIHVGDYHLNMGQLLLVLVIFVITKITLWVIRKSLMRSRLFNTLDQGQMLAYYQVTKYVVIVIAVAYALESLGIKVTFLLAGSAALLVGIGLGLQQLFNDLVSGFIILTEHSIKVGDIIEVDDIVSKVKQIGLRTSKVETRSGIFIIIPNSKIVNEKVINWSHSHVNTLFHVRVGVAYGSDVSLVSSLLKQSALEIARVDSSKESEVRFIDFGDSALVFDLLFWSKETFAIEAVKSELRFAINQKFLEHHIQIPFPQRDLHIKSALPILSKEEKKDYL